MATLRKIKGNYYARVRWSINHKQYERIYPLLAEDDGQADLRLGEVEEKEHLIKQEIEIAFWWLIENGERTHQVIYTLAEAVEEFLQHLSRYGRKQSTIEIRRQTFKNVFAVISPTTPAESFDNSCINKFIDHYQKILTPNGINMRLAHLKTFSNWLYDDKEIITKRIKMKKMKVKQKDPSYLTADDIHNIWALDWLDDHYKDVFRFYWETGVRLREPYNSYIKNGSWLINTENKSGKTKRVKLQPHHIPIVEEIQKRLEKGNATQETFGKYYSTKFKEVARAIGRDDLHFHNLRDTYAIIRYLQTRDIYEVCKELNHSSVTITEKYANFTSFEELEEDFPGDVFPVLVDRDLKKCRMLTPEGAKTSSPPMGSEYVIG